MKAIKKFRMLEEVLKTLRRYEMIRRGDRVVAAVSGGPDSVFLLHALYGLRRKLGIELFVASLDHGLRGRESEVDLEFVRGLSDRLGLRIYHKTIDLKKLADRKLSQEESARLARYQLFKEAAGHFGANVVATAHTLDDQAETVAMCLIRGSSIKGASGIPPVREEAGGVRIVRPLIELEKAKVLDFLRENAIDFRVDRTNLQNIYFRNVVRNEILPFLEKFNPRIKRALSNFAGHLREDTEFIRGAKAGLSKSASAKGENGVSFYLKDIVVQPRALVKEIVRDSLESVGCEIKKLSYKHWKEIDVFLRVKRKGAFLDLPGGIRMARGATTLDFARIKT